MCLHTNTQMFYMCMFVSYITQHILYYLLYIQYVCAVTFYTPPLPLFPYLSPLKFPFLLLPPFPSCVHQCNSGTSIGLSSCLLIRFKDPSAGENAWLLLLTWPRTHGWGLIGPRDDSNTIILLNRHSIKLFNTMLNHTTQHHSCPDV